MDAFWFVAKSLVVTVIVVMALQIQIGTSSIESHINKAARTSGIIDLAQDMADGTSRVVKSSWNGFVGAVNKMFNVEKRTGPISFERSREYLKRKSEEAKEGVETTLRQSQKRIIDETAFSKSEATD